MDVCSRDHAGEPRLHRHLHATPEARRKALAPDRDPRVIAAEWLLTWDWRADLWAAPGLPGVLGHALSLTAIQGGKANHDTLDAQTSAVRRRGGRRPQAEVEPAARRAPRDRRRRRTPLARPRGALLAHGHTTHSPSHRPAIGTTLASHATRDGVAARCPEPAGPQSLDVDRARIGCSEAWLRDRARAIVRAAQPHDAQTC
jgi:hypothetical protein